MSGFKNFLLRGNLIEVAVAFIIATSFAAVVTAFTAWLTSVIPGVKSAFDDKKLGGHFGNTVIAFVVLAAIVYFAIVVPYTKAKERFFPSPEPGTPEDVKLLQEIRDLLVAQQDGGTATITPPAQPGT
jgi:large conductance mechanosensitive channel